MTFKRREPPVLANVGAITILLANPTLANLDDSWNEYRKYYDESIPGERNAQILYHLSLTLLTLSVASSLYVIHRTQHHYHQSASNLSIGERLPAYMAGNNALIGTSAIVNIVRSLICGVPFTGTACRMYGFLDTFLVANSVALVAAVAIRAYLRVVRSSYVRLGRYDYRLFGVTTMIGLSLATISIPSYGPAKHWCLATPGKWILAIALSSLIFVTAVICVMCYSAVLWTINTIDQPIEGGAIKSAQQKRATVRILLYTFSYFVQWIPAIPFLFSIAIENDSTWLYFLYMISFNFGAIANAVQYFFNQRHQGDEPVSTLTSPAVTPPGTIRRAAIAHADLGSNSSDAEAGSSSSSVVRSTSDGAIELHELDRVKICERARTWPKA